MVARSRGAQTAKRRAKARQPSEAQLTEEAMRQKLLELDEALEAGAHMLTRAKQRMGCATNTTTTDVHAIAIMATIIWCAARMPT